MKKLKKETLQNKIYLNISVIFMIITIFLSLFYFVYLYSISKTKNNFIDFAFKDKINIKYTRLDNVKNVIYIYDDHYYVLTDNNVFIARLSYNKVQDIKRGKKQVDVFGKIMKTSDKVLSSASETYNVVSEKETITKDNISKYLGKYYIDQKSNTKYNNIVVIFLIVFISISIAMSIIYITLTYKKLSKSEKKENKEKRSKRLKK